MKNKNIEEKFICVIQVRRFSSSAHLLLECGRKETPSMVSAVFIKIRQSFAFFGNLYSLGNDNDKNHDFPLCSEKCAGIFKIKILSKSLYLQRIRSQGEAKGAMAFPKLCLCYSSFRPSYSASCFCKTN